jgi:hypothetical protein
MVAVGILRRVGAAWLFVAVTGGVGVPAAAAPQGPVDPALLQAVDQADLRMRVEGFCSAADVALMVQAAETLEALSPGWVPAQRWVFPVPRVKPGASLGGRQGSGYVANRPRDCYATPHPGHPAHDLFVDDPRQVSRDARGQPWDVRAVEAGWVLVARDGWQPGDALKGGNYVLLYLPGRRRIAYYAHLERTLVRPGELVAAGQPLGLLGRTGLNAYRRRSPTHLHFALWDARTLTPDNPYRLLRDAWPAP